MIRNIFFSPSGTTQQIAEKIAADLEGISESYNLTVSEKRNITLNEGDIVIVSCPVYAGRIPPIAINRLRHLKGNGQKAIIVVVFGNRDYDDALLELCDIVSHKGFKIVAAAAFVAQHCIFPQVAHGRPDRLDDDKIHDFTISLAKTLASGKRLDVSRVKGSRPYKKPGNVPLHPITSKSKCTKCGICVKECPVQAIPEQNPLKTDSDICITCCRCINVCPHKARHLGGLLYKIARWKFIKNNSERLEPVWFL